MYLLLDVSVPVIQHHCVSRRVGIASGAYSDSICLRTCQGLALGILLEKGFTREQWTLFHSLLVDVLCMCVYISVSVRYISRACVYVCTSCIYDMY